MKQMPVQSTVPYRHETGASHRRAGCRHQTWSSGRQGCPGRSREQRYLRIHDRKSQNRRRYRISDPRRAGGHETVILLDTHVLVWLSTEPTKLSKQASLAIRRAARSGTSPFARLRSGNWPGLPVMPASCVPGRILGRQGRTATSKQSATLLYTTGQTMNPGRL